MSFLDQNVCVATLPTQLHPPKEPPPAAFTSGQGVFTPTMPVPPSYTHFIEELNAPVVTVAPGAGSVPVPVVGVGHARRPGSVSGQAIAGQPTQASHPSPTIVIEANNPELPVSPNPVIALGVTFCLL